MLGHLNLLLLAQHTSKIACRIFYLNWKLVQDIYLKGADMMANFFTQFLANIFDFAVIFKLV